MIFRCLSRVLHHFVLSYGNAHFGKMAYNSWSLPNTGQTGWTVTTLPLTPDQQTFNSLYPTNGLLSGAQARPVFQQSGLSSDQLAQVWAQVDRNGDGYINCQEFCHALTLIRQLKSSSLPMTHSISSSGIGAESGWGVANPAHSLPTRSYGSTSTLPMGSSSPFPGGGFTGGRGTSSPAVSGGVGRNVSLASLTPTWCISPNEKRRFLMTFNTNDKDKKGYLTGEEARRVLTRYELDKDILRKIWDLADHDKDGNLTSEELAVALYLVEKATKGVPPPSSLPPDLIPKKGPAHPGGQSPSMASTLEDEKRKNFERGRAELEKRRKEIQDRERKEKEDQERRRQEEEERRREDEQRLAAAREAELERQRQRALEIERERERAMQQALLKKEAELRAAERRRMEEWVGRRRQELENERRHERAELDSIRHQHQLIVDQLSQSEVERRTVTQRVQEERQRCAELAAALDVARQQQADGRGRLMGVATELKNWRQELSRLEYHRQQLQGHFAVQMTGNEGEVHSQLTSRQEVLSATLNRLRGVVNESSAQYEQARVERREKEDKMARAISELHSLERRMSQLKEAKVMETKRNEETLKRQKAFEETQRRQREIQNTLRARKEEEKRMRLEKERRDLEEKGRGQDGGKEEEMKNVLEKEFDRLKKISVEKKVEPVTRREGMSGGRVRPRSQVISEGGVDDITKKVVELQARRRELKEKRESPRQESKAISELEGINFGFGVSTVPVLPPLTQYNKTPPTQHNTPPTQHKTPPTNDSTPSLSHIYESTDTILPIAKATPISSSDSHIYEFPDKVMSRHNATPTDKPTLPPKPGFLKHAHHNDSPPCDHTPQPIPTPTTELPQYEVMSPVSIATPVTMTTSVQKPEERIYDEPPKIEEAVNKDDEQVDKQEPLYDEPPRERLHSVKNIANRFESGNFGRKSDPWAQNGNEAPVFGNEAQFGNEAPVFGNEAPVFGNEAPVYGNEAPVYGNEAQFGNEAPVYGNVSSEQYGNEAPQYGNVTTPSEPLYGNTSADQSSPDISRKGSLPPSSLPPSLELKYRAQFQYAALNDGEISFNQGEVLIGCPGNAQDGWIKVEKEGRKGWAPMNYLQRINDTAATTPSGEVGECVRVKFPWNGTKPNHLSLSKGQLVTLKEKGDEGWWLGETDGKVGWFPHKFVEEVTEPVAPDDPLSPLPPAPEVNELHKAIYSFQGEHDGDLSFPEGSILTILKKEKDWWLGEYNGNQGMFPSNYVSPLVDDTNPIDMDTLSIGGLGGPGEVTPKGTRKHTLLGRVIVGFTGIEEGQLSLVPGQLVVIRRQESNGWWEGQLQSRGEERRCGWFPANRIELMTAMSNHTMSPNPPANAPGNSNAPVAIGDDTPPTTTLVLALYSYQANSSDELSFHKGSVISVVGKDEADWWKGELNGQIGLFPSNYVQSLDTLKQSDPIHWSDHVKPEIIDKVPSKERKRQEAIFELIHSEKSYVFSLNLVKEVFFIPLENSNILTPDEIAQVFVNWEEIIEHNTTFCNALFIRLRTSGAIVRIIGDLLQDNIPQLAPHIRWCSCQLTACTLLQSKAADPQFKELEAKCLKDTRTGGLPLSSFLLKPMQRVTKYPLLIKKILEYTNPSESDYQLLQSSMKMAEDLCSQVNEAVMQKEDSEKLEWVQTHVQMSVSEKLVFNSSTNFMGSRKLLHCSKILKVRGNKEMVLFLFNDFLLLARPKALFPTVTQMEPFNPNNHFIMHREPFLLDQVLVKKLPDEPCGFTVIPKQNNEKDVPFRADTEVARDQWYKVIMEATINFTRKKKQANRLGRSDSRRVTLQKQSKGKLIVTVFEANDLVASSNGKSDPFCVVKVGEEGQEGHTPVVKNTLNPHWNYAMEFFITDFDSSIDISVFDSDLFSPNDFLGCSKMSLKQLREEGPGPWRKRVLLDDVPRGELELRIVFKQQIQRFH